MGDLLFAPPSQNPRAPWKVSDFVSVDDTVRGGSSHSAMRLVEDTEAFHGAIDFTGFLDTTTLGGAGFASQAYSHPIPGHSLDPESYSGLSLTFTPLPLQSLSSSFPGGGKGPVQSYVLNLKTEKPKRRPDGRRESQLVYEWKIDVPQKAEAKQHDALHAQASWSQFVATYRGRPVEDAPLLDPSRIQEWSVMARSDFGVRVWRLWFPHADFCRNNLDNSDCVSSVLKPFAMSWESVRQVNRTLSMWHPLARPANIMVSLSLFWPR